MYFLFLMTFLIMVSFLPAYFIVRIQYIMHTTCKIHVSWLLSVRLLVNSRPLVWGQSKVMHRFFLTMRGVSTPNPHVVQESPVRRRGICLRQIFGHSYKKSLGSESNTLENTLEYEKVKTIPLVWKEGKFRDWKLKGPHSASVLHSWTPSTWEWAPASPAAGPWWGHAG